MAISDLIARREAVMDKADRALDAASPSRQGSEFVNAMQSAETELKDIADEMKEEGASEVEQSRVHRYRGSILSDLAPALGKTMLKAARDAYLQSEALLEGHDDPVEHAKLNFNFGNTLRQIDPNDVRRLREAERRFLAAKAVFEQSAPQFLPRIEKALSSTRSLIALAPVAQSVNRARDDMAKLEERLATGTDLGKISTEIREVMNRGGGPAALLGQIRGLMNTLPDTAKEDPRYAQLVEQLEQAASLAAGGTRRADPEVVNIIEALRKRLKQEAAEGRVSGDREQSLLAMLDKFSKTTGSGAESIQELMKTVADMRSTAESMFETNHYLSHGIDRPTRGSRAAELVELWWRLRLALLREGIERDKTQSERSAVIDLSMRATKLDKRIYEVGAEDRRAQTVEREGLRPLAVEVRQFTARHYPLLVTPFWSTSRVQIDPNGVLFSGSPVVRRKVAGACKKLGFDLLSSPKGHDVATARWRQLQQANIAVFDLSADEGPTRAAVAYELGIARTLGRSVVVLADHDQTIPFDVDSSPTLLSGDRSDAGTIRDALDEAAVWVMPRPREETIAETITAVLREYPLPGTNTYADQTLKQLRRLRDEPGPLDTKPDPLAVRDALKTLVTYLGDPAPMLIFPPWPPAYRVEDTPRLFHVTPFGPDWANDSSENVERACEAIGAEYVRGDRVTDPEVIRSIWKEIIVASHVVVDLTGFNLNVALELGISHTLGRPTLLVGQGDTVKRLYPTIAKLRLHPYADAAGSELTQHVTTFLSPLSDA
jgi:hypothetical protein